MTTTPVHETRFPASALLLAALTTLLLLFGIGALGIVGSGGARDLPYLAAPVVALLGVGVARARAGGSALALAAAAGTAVLVGAGQLVVGLPDGASGLDVVMISLFYAGLYAASAWLAARAAR